LKRVFIIAATVPFFLLLLLPEIVVPWFITIVAVLFGWIPSGLRLAQACRPTFGASFVLALALAAFIGGTHFFISWMLRNWRDQQNLPRLAEWRWKWTLCGFGIIVCSVLAISALILTTHQIYWLAKSSDPLFVDPRHERFAVTRLAMTIKSEADASNWNPSSIRKLILSNDGFVLPAEVVDPVIMDKGGKSIKAIVLVCRHPLLQSGAKLAVVRPDTTNSILPVDELSNVLASFQDGEAAPR
jgi:hypothetical protein